MRSSFFVLIALFMTALVVPAQALETEKYLETSDAIIKTAKRGKVKDVDRLIGLERELIRLGVEACLEYAEKNPTDLKLMQLIVLNSQRMQNLTLEAIQKEWIEGAYPAAHGVTTESLDAKDPAQRMLNSVVRPATSIVALKDFKKSKNTELLQRVQQETEIARAGVAAQAK